MIYAYGVSLPGTDHIKSDTVCQDYHKIIRCSKDVAIAAVADGLGSAAHAEVGSRIAATVAAEHCRQYISTNNAAHILDVIRAAFVTALRAVEKEANSKDRSQDLYDTTLTLAVLVRDTLYYGHSGDSGIVALTTQGRYEQVTTQQRDEEGRVFPLFFVDKWEFAQYGEKVSAVLLATDGMLEPFFPMYIRNEPVNIHVSLAQFFMDNRSLRIDKVGEEAVQTGMRDYIESIPAEQVSDDKTVAVLVNTAVRTKRQPRAYYLEPDWAELKRKHDEAWKREAYPGLYKDAPTAEATGTPAGKHAGANSQALLRRKESFEQSLAGRKRYTRRGSRVSKVLLALIAVCVVGVIWFATTTQRPADVGASESTGEYITIAGRQHCTSSTWILLSGQNLSDEDIAQLRYMTNLTSLFLNNNEISDLTPLSDLANLSRLRLHQNQVSDLTPLAGLTNLRDLWLQDNQISDLTPLAGLANSVNLYLDGNQIDEINDWSPVEHIYSVSGRPIPDDLG